MKKEEQSKFPIILAGVLVFIGILFSIWLFISFSNTGTQPIQEVKTTVPTAKTISIFVDALPFDVDRKYANAVREAIAEWEKVNPDITFRETDLQNADVNVQWVKEFGGHPLGQVVKRDFVQIGLGDSICLGKWRTYTYETVLLIATHEFGHVLGLEHSNDPNNVMYESIITKYEIDIDERDFLPDGSSRFYPMCTKSNIAIYSIEVTSDEELDIYVVPSREDYDLFVSESTFNHYPSCEGTETKFYQKTCTVPQGSGVILTNPTIFGLGNDAIFTIKTNEI